MEFPVLLCLQNFRVKKHAARKLIVDGEEVDGSFLPYDKIAGKQSVEIKVVY